ncbi:MAG: aminopeptidase [Phycisphaerales bacterium]|nr:aminopeptidase [Phycisphaerales bacterium]
MRDPRLDKLADVLVRYSTKVKKGDLVCVTSDPVAMPLVEATFEAVLRAGGNPFYVPRSESLQEILLSQGSQEQIQYCSPIDLHRVEKIDVQIGFWAEVNTKYLSTVDPKRVASHQAARKPWFKVFMERAAKSHEPGGLRWVGTQYPTTGSAQDAEMSLRQYEDFVFRAGLLHLPDPVGAWTKVFENQQRVADYLTGKKALHFRVPPHKGHDGTDLRVDVSKATWVNCGGLENFPDGEVFAGPTLPSLGGFGVEGHVNYSFPAVYQGREVEGVRLAFKGGRVVDASARKNEKFLLDMLDQDAGARNLGEIAIGTNYGITDFSRNTLFDEKIGGTFHAAVGAGYPESGSNNESGLHWDMVCDLRVRNGHPGGTISADGEVFHKDGNFLPVTGFKVD